jgi:transcriptional regulator with GAF, ATPase, and Fis domain/pSer/pThr/pTyr-binding forkhead associated (FHA) protein
MKPAIIAFVGSLKGARFELTHTGISIGRDPSNDVCINDLSVSRHHCIVQANGGKYLIVDRETINGTCVNGISVAECELKCGDQIGVGDNLFRFVTEEEEDQASASPASLEESGWVATPTIRLNRDQVLQLQPQQFIPQAGSDRARRELEILLRVGEMLDCVKERKGVALRLLELIAEGVPARNGAIVLNPTGWSPERSTFGWQRDAGRSPAPQVSSVILGQVMRDGAAVLSNDITAAGAQSLLSRRVTSVMAVPLLLREEVRGAIYLDTPDPVQVFDEDHLRFLTAISGFAALALDNADRIETLRSENRRLQGEAEASLEVIGESAPIRELHRRIAKVAPTDATVLILGETGTGKELAARAVHLNSARRDRPFEAINCSLLKETFLESELFGHEKGAFTGAIALKRGKLETANGGTVFLDEVGELGAGPQAMLLRVLQDRAFQRLGGMQTIRVDVRLIAATNRNLEEGLRDKTFREDLFYRLNVVSISMAPLRDRRSDIPLLAAHFARSAARKNKRFVRGISPAALDILMRHSWPGNVRELQNTMEYAVIFGSMETIAPEDLPESLLASAREKGARIGRYHEAVKEAKQQIIANALKQANYNYVEAAAILDIHVNNLYRLVRELDLKLLVGGSSARAN